MSPSERQVLSEFKMPFGKFKGETLAYLYAEHSDYLEWCCDNLENDVGDKIRKYYYGDE